MKIGIAGAGNIVPDFLKAQAKVAEIEPFAICASTRSKERMEGFAAEYGISRIYFSYDDMLEDPDLEAIYVAVPNHLHYEFSKKALNKGLHVICEKPFCVHLSELQELKTLAEEKELFLFEAITNQYYPNFAKVKQLLPKIGQVRIVEMNYTQYSSRYDAFKAGDIKPAFDPAKNGGALNDLNVYNIHLTTGLFGRPEKIQYFPNMQKGVDTSGILVLQYPDMSCVLIAAKDCCAPCSIRIEGENGYIFSQSPSNSLDEFTLSIRKGETKEYHLNQEPERLYHELHVWADKYAEKDYDFFRKALEHSLIVQEVLEKAHDSI